MAKKSSESGVKKVTPAPVPRGVRTGTQSQFEANTDAIKQRFLKQRLAGIKVEDALRVAHSVRFRSWGNGVPRAVSGAYDRDLLEAMESTDREVAERLLAFLEREGVEMEDWRVCIQKVIDPEVPR